MEDRNVTIWEMVRPQNEDFRICDYGEEIRISGFIDIRIDIDGKKDWVRCRVEREFTPGKYWGE